MNTDDIVPTSAFGGSEEVSEEVLEETLESDVTFSNVSRAYLRETLTGLIKKHGLNFTYVRPVDDSGEPSLNGGATIAWTRYDSAYSNFKLIKVSIAWCKHNESFNKLLGRHVAATAFDNGHWINVKVADANSHVSYQLQQIFGPLV